MADSKLELDRLVVKIVGDAQNFFDTIDEVEKSLVNAGKTFGAAARSTMMSLDSGAEGAAENVRQAAKGVADIGRAAQDIAGPVQQVNAILKSVGSQIHDVNISSSESTKQLVDDLKSEEQALTGLTGKLRELSKSVFASMFSRADSEKKIVDHLLTVAKAVETQNLIMQELLQSGAKNIEVKLSGLVDRITVSPEATGAVSVPLSGYVTSIYVLEDAVKAIPPVELRGAITSLNAVNGLASKTVTVEIKADITKINEVVPALEKIEEKIKNFSTTGAASESFNTLAKALQRIGGFLKAVKAANIDKLDQVLDPLKRFTEGFAQHAQTLEKYIPAYNKITLGLQRIGTYIRAVNKIDAGEEPTFQKNTETFTAAVDQMIKTLGRLDAGTSGVIASIVSRFANFAKAMTKNFDAGTLNESLGAFIRILNGLFAQLRGITVPELKELTKVTNTVRGVIRAFGKSFDSQLLFQHMGAFVRLLDGLFKRLDAIVVPGLKELTARVNMIRGVMRTFGKAFNEPMVMANMDAFASLLEGLFTRLSSITVPGLKELTKTVNMVRGVLRSFGRAFKEPLLTQNMDEFTLMMQVFFMNLDAVMVPGLKEMTRKVNMIRGILRTFGKAFNETLITDNMKKFANAIQDFFNQLDKIKVPDLDKLLKAMTRVRNLVKDFSKAGTVNLNFGGSVGGGGGGGGFNWFAGMGGSASRLPPVINRVERSFASLPSPIRATNAGLTGTNFRFRDLITQATAAGSSLNILRFSLMGLAGFSIRLFARMDDELTKVLIKLREWPHLMTHASTKAGLQSAVMEMSTKTVTGTTDLAHGLEILAGTGMSAGLAVRALAEAETFAVASSMDLADATKHLIDIQNMTGLASQNVEQHMENMRRISDLIVGMAPMVGSSAKQMSEALGDKFVMQMKLANMSLEEGIALLGVYSLRGIRGAEASDRAARALSELGRRSLENVFKWRALGIEVHDAQGAFVGVQSVMSQLSDRMAGLSHMQRVASLALLGFENRAIAAVLPLIDMHDAMRQLEEETKKVGGIAAMAAEMLRQDFMGQMKIMWNQLQALAAQIGKALAPMISVFAKVLGQVVGYLNSLNPAVRNLIIYTGLFIGLLRPGVALVTAVFGYLLRTVDLLLAPLRMAVSLVGMLISGVQMLFSAVVASVSAMSSMFRLMVRAIAVPFRVLGVIVRGVVVAFMGMYSAVKLAFSVVVTTFSVIISTGLYVKQAFNVIIEGAKVALAWISALARSSASFAEFIAKAGMQLGNVVFSALGSAISAIISLLTTFTVGFVALAVAAVPAMMLITTAIASVGAVLGSVVITAGLAFKQLIMFIPTALAGIGKAIKDLFTNDNGGDSIWKKMLDGIENFKAASGEVWKNIKAGAADAFTAAGQMILNLAGFFWNFQENVQIIFKWMRENWNAIIEEMGRIAVHFVESMGHNIQVLAEMIMKLTSQAWQTAWIYASRYAELAFVTIEQGWDFMLQDMKMLFDAFIEAVIRNFRILMPVLKDIIQNFLAKNGAFGPAGMLFAQDMDYAKMLKDAFGKMQGLDLNGKEFKIGKVFDGLKDDLQETQEAIARDLAKSGIDFAKTVNDAMKDFKNPLKAFGVELPGLKLELPDDWIKKLEEKFKALFSPQQGVPEDVGPIGGKQGPGFTFKQTSLSRFVIGGPAEQRLELQSLLALKSIDNHLLNLIGAVKGLQPLRIGQ